VVIKMNSDIVILIPARGGSTRIKNKNLRILGDKSLLAWAIEASKGTTITKIYVSTDSEEIKKEALRYNINVIDRPKEISNSESTSESAMIHFVNNIDCDAVLMTECTCPFINSYDLQQMIDKYNDGNYDSITLLDKKMLFINRIDEDLIFPVNYNPYNRKRSQDFDSDNYTYCESGAWLVSKEFLLKNNCRMGGRNGYVIKSDFNIDIDYEDDLKIAEGYLYEGL